MDSVVQYLNRHNQSNSEQALLEENRQLRVYIQQMSDEYHRMQTRLEENKAVLSRLIDGNYPKVTNPNGLMTKCYRIIKFREAMLRQNNIDPSNAQQISNLPINSKRAINLNILAFGELLSLPEIVSNYLRTTHCSSMTNLKKEADILAHAITKNDNTTVHALQAWGYLQMMLSVNNGTIHYLDVMLDTFNDEAKANQWLKDRVTQLIAECKFEPGSTMPIEASIPQPLQMWEIDSINHKLKRQTLSATISKDRPDYAFDISNPCCYPSSPKGQEIIIGPVSFLSDEALIWGEKLTDDSDIRSQNENADMTIEGLRIPTLLNKGKDEPYNLPHSENSMIASLLPKYGIK
jgi:hypothetical protein